MIVIPARLGLLLLYRIAMIILLHHCLVIRPVVWEDEQPELRHDQQAQNLADLGVINGGIPQPFARRCWAAVASLILRVLREKHI